MDALTRFAGRVSAFAAYRPAGVGALRHIPAESLGIAHYHVDEVRTLGHESLVSRAGEIATELEALEAVTDWGDEQRASFDALNAELSAIEGRQALLAERAQVRARAAKATSHEPVGIPTVNLNRKTTEDPFDLDSLRYGAPVAEVRGRAKHAVESIDYIDDSAKAAAIRKLEKMNDPRGVLPGLILRTGSPVYQDAFQKGLAGRMDLWTDAERRAVATVEEFRAAMGLTDANGGYAIPFVLDPSIILTNNGAANPVRQVARTVTVAGDNWNGITSAGVTASFDAEAAEVSDDSPTFAQPSVTVRMARAFVYGSIEISQDFRNLAGELSAAFADAKDRLESTVFWSGAAGSNQPIGLETALAGGSSIVAPGTAETFAVGDIYKTQAALPPRHRNNGRAVFMAEQSTINAIRQFATANNYHAFLVDLGAGNPAQLLGSPLYEWSDMDAHSAINPAATAANHILVYGDFSKYVIADRVGGTVEFIPHMFATANNLPSFQRGWVYYWRVGADSIDDGAFRLLNIATTA